MLRAPGCAGAAPLPQGKGHELAAIRCRYRNKPGVIPAEAQ